MLNFRKALLVSLVLLGGLLTALMSTTSPAQAAATCDRYASPSGSWNGSGSVTDPVQTVAELDAVLTPGQTGCLEAGDYGSITTNTDLYTSGTADAPITITTAPGQTSKITGLIMLWANYTTLSGLNIDGSNTAYAQERPGTSCPYPVSNGLEINGHNDTFENNDFYQSIPSLRGNGIGVGWNGQADGTIIRYNRIHDVGQCLAQDHLIYLAHADGAQIYDNWMWNDRHGWGVQLYPGASNAHVYDNVIDRAGSGFVVGGSAQVAGNVIDHNIVMNSTGPIATGLNGVGVSTCCGIGPNNIFEDNDVYHDRGGVAVASGMTVTNNSTSNPQLADPTNHDYRPTVQLPGYTLWDGNLGSIAVARTTRVAQSQRTSSPGVARTLVARVARAHVGHRGARHHRRTLLHRRLVSTRTVAA